MLLDSKIIRPILGVLALFCVESQLFAEENEGSSRTYDYSFVTGGTIGLVVDPTRKKGNQEVGFGGIPLGARITTSSDAHYSLVYQAGILLDLGNNQVVQQGGEFGVSWHFIGGARKVKRVSSLGTIFGTSPYDLSLLARVGYFQFSASSINDPSDRVTGAVVDFRTGIGYRRDILYTSALAVEIMATVYSIPASLERISHSALDFSLIWRAEI